MLIVDDVRANRMLLYELFKEEFKIMEAEDGDEAVKILEQGEKVHIVLLDLVMPNRNGFSVMEYILRDPKLATVPIVVTTQCEEEEMKIKALNLGACDYITKPYCFEKVSYTVHKLLKKAV